ncbi:MAG TPA: hypothetical protein VLX09_05305 [Stellaceae bacterium]|nr:hypothetical protein [Stellaceae bacterium]
MKLARYANVTIAVVLLAAGLGVIHWPWLTGDATVSAPATAASLAGALFGAGALFLGAQINEYLRRQNEQQEAEDKVAA